MSEEQCINELVLTDILAESFFDHLIEMLRDLIE